ncbi:MAG: SDR family NAD(P)-dependent oxidoreductase [Planctomycetia bacterium]|nr:SDR family NAD(P)-dependent oxidoreductase [Planctomycetia bacterium]
MSEAPVSEVPLSCPPVAIVGLGCLFPKAAGLERCWANILNRVDAIGPVPASHWRPEDYFNTDAKKPDHTYAQRGGFLSPVDFPALDFGISPNRLEATDSTQLLGLLVAKQALEDAGYGTTRTFDRDKVSVILGVTGTLPLVIPLGARLGHPHWRKALKDAGVPDDQAEDVVQRIADAYVGWQEDSFPGLLGNVVAGRIANRLDLGGTNCVVDAACASSLSAVHLALCELATGRANMVLTGGMDSFNDIFMYMCFSKTPALSPTGDSRPFDAKGDGTILGEGLGCLLLKRLADAERDGDRIYAVIRGLGTSSDGKGQAIYAPSSAGQVRCLQDAYRRAGVTPDTIELVEAHGTGTRAGDAAEVTALNEVYSAAGKQGSWCALGSIKSQIGHTKAAAGAAGLIKAALSLYHKVLPPTLKVEQPIEPLQPGKGAFYVNTEKRPWLPGGNHPRRAAVSSFGFGGSNFHCVLEEYRPAKERIDWDSRVQLLAFSADSPESLEKAVAAFPASLSWDELRVEAARSRATFRAEQRCRLTVVLEEGKSDAAKLLASFPTTRAKFTGKSTWSTPDGLFYGEGAAAGQLAMLFPGQGSQYVGMLRDLACAFPQVQQALAEANAAGARLSDFIYPQPVFNETDRARNDEALRNTAVAQPALGALGLGALNVLAHCGVRPQAVAGHSYGELVALHAAGRFDSATLHRLSRLRGKLMTEGQGDRGSMLAVQSAVTTVKQVLKEERIELVVANRNTPKQVVLSGATADIRRAAEVLARRNITAKVLPVAAAFHSPFVAGVKQQFAQGLADVPFARSAIPVYSNTTAQPYPDEPQAARSLLAGQLAEPVAFVEEIEALYRAGVRTFVEVGPSNKLTGMVGAILEGREHSAFAVDASSGQRNGFLDLARVLAPLAALGHRVELQRWDDGIDPTPKAIQKPTLTVPITGANYVKPKPPRPPRQPVPVTLESKPVPKHAEPQRPSEERQPVVQETPVLPAPPVVPVSKPAAVPTPIIAAPSTTTKRTMQPESTASASFQQQALRATQENLQALQKLGEQTAQLHGQFLDNQNRALLAFQSLLEQQQRWFQRTVAGAPVTVVPQPVALPKPAAVEARPVPVAVVPPPAAVEPPVIAPPVVEKLATPEPAIAKPPAATSPRSADILLAIVADKTGYPAEMLGLDMELDADLGIDSIKRVEIFSAVQERLPDAPAIKPEHLGTLRTLRSVVEFLGATTEPQAASQQPPIAQPLAASPTPPPAADLERMIQVVLAVVADKTGYPAEMLGLDMELDADLGIDSIKRVEIFSAVQEKLPDAPVVKPEHLGTLRTLRSVVEFLGQQNAPLAAAPPEPLAVLPSAAQPQAATSFVPTASSLQRYILEAAALDQTAKRPAVHLATSGEVWITEDDAGLAQRLAARLSLTGPKPRLVRWHEVAGLARPASLAGLVVLAPKSADDAFLLRAFELLQLAGPGLRQAGKSGGAVFATVSRLDGAFGLTATPLTQPLSGGLAGLSKTVGHEWPEVHCKAIDLAESFPDLDEAVLAIADELLLAGPEEVGVAAAGRCTLRLVERSLAADDWQAPLQPGDVLLVSGGARGVTAECCVALGKALTPTLVLLGRTPLPPSESDATAKLRAEADIKRALLTQHPQASPREVGELYRALLANREIRQNLDRIRSTGARVEYRAVDIRDEDAVRAVVQEIRSSLGPVRGLVHGAGVLADRRIEDKTREQFQSVYGTKVQGLRNLLAALQTDELKVLALFSSSTGRFGRTGQVDYAVANEVLNKLAQQEAQRRPGCRVASLNWGPWDGGMVTPALKAVFEEEGVGVIPLTAGAELLVHTLGSQDRAVEAVILGGGSSLPVRAQPAATTTPGLSSAFEREISLDTLPVLRSHVVGGRAVLPMALSIEWLAHAALHGNPGLLFHGFDELRILKGVRLSDGQSWRLKALAGKLIKTENAYAVPVELHAISSDGRSFPHARASVVLVSKLPKATGTPPVLPVQPYERDVEEVYRDLLFHGPDLHGIQAVDSFSSEGIVARMAAAPPPPSWLRQPLRSNWLADPLALDAAFQLLCFWTYETQGAYSLPAHAGGYRQYRRSFPADGVRVVAHVKQVNAHRALVDYWFLDRADEVVAHLSEYDCVIDASLNQAFRRNQLTADALPSR